MTNQQSPKSTVKKGVQLAFATATISGFSNFVNKISVAKIQPLVHTTLKNLLVFLFLTAVCILFSKAKQFKKLTAKDWGKLVLIGIIGGSLPFYLFFTALAQMPAINAAIIHKSLVFWVAFLAVPLLKEKFNYLYGMAIALLFTANTMIGGFKGFAFSTPELMVLAATLLWAVENIIAKVTLKRVDPMIVAGARMGFGSLILIFATEVTGKMPIAANLSWQQWGMVLITAVLLFGYVTTWYSALKYAPAITVASILVSATLITNILSALFITHAFGLQQLAQGVAMIAGLVLLVRASAHNQQKQSIQSVSN